MTLELYAKASGFSFLPSQFWAAMPYIMAVVVLAVISARDVAAERTRPPASAGPSCRTPKNNDKNKEETT